MTRRLRPEEERLWRALTDKVAPADGGRVRRVRPDEQRMWQAATGQSPIVRPAPAAPDAHAAPDAPPATREERPSQSPPITSPKVKAPSPPGPIEPRRRRRLARGRDPIEATIDLHGLDQDRARAALERFLGWAHGGGMRAVLVITGKGLRSDGVLRRRTPDWLTDPKMKGIVAGYSLADARHGGEGAIYVALKA